MKKIVLLFSIFFLTPLMPYAEESTPSLMADRDSYNIGDPIKLKVELKGSGYSIADIDASSISPFEISGQEEIYNEEKGTTSFIIKGAIYEVGEFTIPPLVFLDSDGNKLISESGLIVIKAVREKDDDELREIKPQMTVDERGPVYPWIVLAIIVILIAVLIFYLYRRKKALAPVPVIPPKPPYLVAMEALDEIEGMKLLRDGEIKSLYTRVSDVLRCYEGALYGLDAMEMTTGELTDALKKNGFSGVSEVSRFLNDCDKVKFAKYSPPDIDAEGIMDRARRIIEKQKVDEAVEESGAD